MSPGGVGRSGRDCESYVQARGRSARPWPWRSSPSPALSESLPESFFTAAADEVARELLGCYLRSTLCGCVVEGVIVETEAYLGPEDPASHAAARRGETRRNSSMFGPPGHAYVYRSYGIHWCLNVVTGRVGIPAAVLVRALDPIQGEETMKERRGGRYPLCAGPGRLGEALGISGELDGHPLSDEPLRLLRGWQVSDAEVGTSGRIGVSRAADRLLRFFLRGHPEVSGRPRW